MKTAPIVALLTVAMGVAADSCNKGGVYCGQSLLNKGNYRDHITETLRAAGVPDDESHIINGLFDCLGGGDIRYRDYCGGGCGGVGSEDPDYCV
ncbi:hypothetical protein N3K66_002805 [Trichothecium roseum]|uniref:Uncharacterized protein n=1 Tax=Trichothecium roseum TaxID=47278 RepID=A0ACC0VCF1_9HYPO|nr:hypothetical protein N3K66_002805 [Trichothecium roseum]